MAAVAGSIGAELAIEELLDPADEPTGRRRDGAGSGRGASS